MSKFAFINTLVNKASEYNNVKLHQIRDMKILNTHTHSLASLLFLFLYLFLFISLFQVILCIIICYQYRYTFNNDLNIQILRKYLKLEYLKIEFESELNLARQTK